MNPEMLGVIFKIGWVGSALLIIYIVYFEWKAAKSRAEQAKIQLGEKENEDQVGNLSDNDLIDLVNSQFSGSSSAPRQKPTGPVPGSVDASGDVKTTGNKKS